MNVLSVNTVLLDCASIWRWLFENNILKAEIIYDRLRWDTNIYYQFYLRLPTPLCMCVSARVLVHVCLCVHTAVCVSVFVEVRGQI